MPRLFISKTQVPEAILPKGYFITEVITLEAKDKNRYLIREQKYEIHSNGGKYLENCDKWYDIDLGRAKP